MNRTGLEKIGIAFIASLIMTTAIPVSVHANDVVVDSSVLDALDPSAGRTETLAPVKLSPPPAMMMKAPDPSLAPVVMQKKMPEPVKAAKKIETAEKPVESRPAASVSSRSAGKVSQRIDLSQDAVPTPKAKPVQTPAPVVAAAPVVVAPQIQEVTIPVPPLPAIAKNIDPNKPPATMKETPNLKAPVSKAVAFPIKTTKKTTGELNPALDGAAPTPTAPVEAQAKTTTAIEQSMDQRDPPAPAAAAVAQNNDWRQANPEKLYSDVPQPKPRPSVTMASEAFVANARRTFENTYKVVNRDGASMPSVPKQAIAAEKLAPARLSVADIAGDPLASRLVALSPDDLAQALNDMTPSSGEPARQLASDLKGNSHPKIVRENGNWNERKAARAQEASLIQSAAAVADGKPNPASGHFVIGFKPAETDMPLMGPGEIDSGVVPALKADTTARVQIVAWSGATDGKEATARRTSLSRALTIRSYLIGKGIDATRMDVRAMGIQQDAKAAPDQVDIILVPDKKS